MKFVSGASEYVVGKNETKGKQKWLKGLEAVTKSGINLRLQNHGYRE